MIQIKMTPIGVLTQLGHKIEELQNASPDTLRQLMIRELVSSSNEQESNFADKKIDELVEKIATLAFLVNSGLCSLETLKQRPMSTGLQLDALINFNHQYTNIPVRQLNAISPLQNVQLALIWYTKYDMTQLGMCLMMGDQPKSVLEKAYHDGDHDGLRNTLISGLGNRSNQNIQKYFQAIEDDNILIGKAAIIMFINRANLKTDDELRHMTTEEQRKLVEDETHFRTGIPSHFLGTDFKADSKLQFLNPLTDQELVEMANAWFVIDKPYAKYNEITSAMAHDSHTGGHLLPKDLYKRPWQDQNNPISEQLQSGIRTVRISSTSGGDLRHSGTDFGTLDDYLKEVAKYFKNNATKDIFTIIDEPTDWSDYLKKIYIDNLGELLFEPGKNGMPSLEELQKGNWPTLKEMVDKGQRVVLFVNKPYDEKNTPWRLPAYDAENFLISMDKDDYGYFPIDVNDSSVRPNFNEVKNQDHRRYKAGNPLYLLNHYFYSITRIASTSYEEYDVYGVGEPIIEYSMNAWAETNQKPNFLNVDFYSLEGKANYLFDLVLAMNRPDAFGPYYAVSKIGRPIQITLADTLEVGQIYTISCVAKNNGTTFNITRGPAKETVSVQPADPTNPQQHWKLIYNTPYPGFALVDPSESSYLCDPSTDDPNRNPKPPKAMYCKSLEKGEKATSFAMIQKKDYWVVYNDRTYDGARVNLSILEVTGGDPKPDRTNIGRWENNKGNNQRWIFNKVSCPEMTLHKTAV
jgi:hypothetical protein